METLKIVGHTASVLIGAFMLFLVQMIDASKVEKWEIVLAGITIGFALQSIFAIGVYFLDKRIEKTRNEIRELLEEKRRLEIH